MAVSCELQTLSSTSHSQTPLPRPRRRRPSRYATLDAIYASKPHRFKLQHYCDEAAYFRSLVDSEEEICRSRKNDLHKLLGSYAAFQSFLVSAVSQSTVLTCRDKWSPICLALTAFVFILWAVALKLHGIEELQERIQKYKDRANAIDGKMEEMKLNGMEFDFSSDPEGGPTAGGKGRTCFACSNYGMLVMVALATFATWIVVSSSILLCRECECACVL